MVLTFIHAIVDRNILLLGGTMSQSFPFPPNPAGRLPIAPSDSNQPEPYQNLYIISQLNPVCLTASSSGSTQGLLLPQPIRSGRQSIRDTSAISRKPDDSTQVSDNVSAESGSDSDSDSELDVPPWLLSIQQVVGEAVSFLRCKNKQSGQHFILNVPRN